MFYNVDIDRKWQKLWREKETYKFDENNIKDKLYLLMMLPYPSGANLHTGHWFNYSIGDAWGRFKKMHGYNVFEPIGYDAFGLPAENYAISTGIHPQDSTRNNIVKMREQLKEMGAMFNFENEITSCEPDYYKWTQWLFLKFYEKGLVFKKKAPVNFCPSCNTVLANEQVKEGRCERCDEEVTKKELAQWFFKITDYAEELLQMLDDLDWPEKTKAMQRHWIGKSIGAEVTFKIKDSEDSFDVFTTRIDTLYGATYAVLAPEHPLVDIITTPENKSKVEEYKEISKKKSDIERQSTTKEKTGVFTGAYAINPINNREIPIWISDYVLATYGTGAVMAVPGHDDRDFEFAVKYSLPIEMVIESIGDLPYCEDGIMVNSNEFSGLTSELGRKMIVQKLGEENKAKETIKYRLRDWLVSRQRYWGCPIPIVYCDKCGEVAVPEEDLPILLPYDVEFRPDGKSPLEKSDEFMHTTCPKCGGKALREPDTLDTFICSSWYFLRYVDNKNDKEAFSKEKIDRMLPVDMYIGGVEHACMHLLYARFFTKALRDMGYLNFDEPFLKLRHQGMILGADGQKMSKSRGNTINPDEYIKEYGSDVFRLYLMFGFEFSEGGPWSDEGIRSMAKFLERSERILDGFISFVNSPEKFKHTMDEAEKELNFVRHNSIKYSIMDAERLQFNTVVARIMEFTNALSKYKNEKILNKEFLRECLIDYIKLLAPLAPHFSEEMWEKLGMKFSVFNEKYPEFDPKALVKDEIEIAIQINGKIKDKIMIAKDLSEDEIKKASLNSEKIKSELVGKNVAKVIVIKGRLVNIVVK
ncbi:MAG: leucine--tRNA ligase [Oscillospiraceae bacterium]|nr:leucine--tRNA ligase [Oscillospiraceae bacterium]